MSTEELSFLFDCLSLDGWLSDDSTPNDMKLNPVVKDVINEKIETITNGPKVFTKHIYASADDFIKGLEKITDSTLDKTILGKAIKTGRLFAEQSEVLHDLVNDAHKNGFDPDDPKTLKNINRVTEIEEELGKILKEHPEIAEDTTLRVAFGAGKSGEFVVMTAGGIVGGKISSAAIVATGWSGAGAIAGVAGKTTAAGMVAYGTNLAYEIDYGDAVRERVFSEGGAHYGPMLHAILNTPKAVEWLDEEATKKGFHDGALAFGGAVVPFGAGKLASLGVNRALCSVAEGSVISLAGTSAQRFAWFASEGSTLAGTLRLSEAFGAATGQATLTGVVTRDPKLTAAGLLIPPSIAFIPRYAPSNEDPQLQELSSEPLDPSSAGAPQVASADDYSIQNQDNYGFIN